MASEISKRLTFTASKGGFSIPGAEWSKTLDMTGDDMDGTTQLVGTAEEVVTVNPDIATVGQVAILNMDTANYVEIGYATGVYVHKLVFGDFMHVPLAAGVVIYAKANTASVRIAKKITEL